MTNPIIIHLLKRDYYNFFILFPLGELRRSFIHLKVFLNLIMRYYANVVRLD